LKEHKITITVFQEQLNIYIYEVFSLEKMTVRAQKIEERKRKKSVLNLTHFI